MRTLTTVLALVLGMAVYATQLAATEEKPDEKVGVILVAQIQDLHLTDDQETKIAEIRKEYQPKVQEAAKDLRSVAKEEFEKIHGVLTADQQKKCEEIREERRESRGNRLSERLAHLEELDLTEAETAKLAEIRKDFRPRIEKTLTQLRGVLTDEQRTAREAALKAGKNRREVMAALKLTDDQKSKIEPICKEVRTLVREEMEKMRDVLSESQRERLRELREERRESVRHRRAHAIANFKELNLTDDQKTKIEEIRKEYRPKVQEAGNKLRATVREEVEGILKVIKD
jgi:Spy/CpxP family protein refolding chaperone